MKKNKGNTYADKFLRSQLKKIGATRAHKRRVTGAKEAVEGLSRRFREDLSRVSRTRNH